MKPANPAHRKTGPVQHNPKANPGNKSRNNFRNNSRNNPYRQAEYLISAHQLHQLPADQGWEVAFAGRSNAGKSSAINTLTEQKSLARTSKTPGRTQQIVIFTIDPHRRIADLPGYGYAKVPAKLRDHWQEVLQKYFETRTSLRGVVLLMDIRHPMRPFDEQMVAWCESRQLPVHLVLTKADKLKRGPAQSTLLKVRRSLPGIATAQVLSTLSGEGRDQLITRLNQLYEIPAANTAAPAGDKMGDEMPADPERNDP
jgi:GTP-binding protein